MRDVLIVNRHQVEVLVVNDVSLYAHLLLVYALQQLSFEDHTHAVLAVDHLIDLLQSGEDGQAEVLSLVDVQKDPLQ